MIKPLLDRHSDDSSDEDMEQEDLKELWSTFVKAREKWKVEKEKRAEEYRKFILGSDDDSYSDGSDSDDRYSYSEDEDSSTDANAEEYRKCGYS